MGLDQYAFSLKPKSQTTMPFEEDEYEDEQLNIANWRKHNRLQGWMEGLYRDKDGEENFNCVNVQLTEDDLTALEETIENRTLPETEGFFFGDDSYADYNHPEWGYKIIDLAFIKESRKRLKQGHLIYYGSWW